MFGYFIERWSENEDRQVILCTFEELPKVNESFDEPVFVWAHIMLPHPPLIFGPNGEAVTPGKPLLIMNHPDFRNSGWDIKQQFVQQLQFTNKKSMEFIDKVLDDGKPSIIIIQGDHGSGFNINWQDPTDDNVIQRLSTFNAIYFPDEEHKEIITDDQTLVNTFRIVFNSYFGSDYEILEDKMYWGYNEKPYMFKDVTSILLEKP